MLFVIGASSAPRRHNRISPKPRESKTVLRLICGER